MKLEINNLTTARIDEGFLKRIVKNVLKKEKKKVNDLSIALVGPKRIKELNKKYRRKNRVTDVLAFSQGLEEVVICLSEVKKNAKRFGLTFKKELARVLIHGILHLLGYNHKKNRETKKMEEKEKFYLSI
jgi:probable rRNA maturation factor